MKQFRFILFVEIIFSCFLFASFSLNADTFRGFEKSDLSPVLSDPGEWGLKIIFIDVGQADAILLVTPNGNSILIDTGKSKSDGEKIASILNSRSISDAGAINEIDRLYITHYDQDHIGGIKGLENIIIKKAYDQGKSNKRSGNKKYGEYLEVVKDYNDNGYCGIRERGCVRRRIWYGYRTNIDGVNIRCVSVRGNTKGSINDFQLDPSKTSDKKFNENPGSVALLIKYKDFEFYTAGDQTTDQWRDFEDTEGAVIKARALGSSSDIDVFKSNHHGSDSSNGKKLISNLLPEVTVISSEYHGHLKNNKPSGHQLPKRISIKQFEDNQSYTLITGNGINEFTHEYTDSRHASEDNEYKADQNAVYNNQGDITILVSKDGKRYTVSSQPRPNKKFNDGKYCCSYSNCDRFYKTFSSIDSENNR